MARATVARGRGRPPRAVYTAEGSFPMSAFRSIIVLEYHVLTECIGGDTWSTWLCPRLTGRLEGYINNSNHEINSVNPPP